MTRPLPESDGASSLWEQLKQKLQESNLFDQLENSCEVLTGAAGDVNELEYISALHQTDLNELRRDASIRPEDIRLFLSSRHGIVVSDQEVRETIMAGLAGSADGTEVFDLMEVVAVLFIPTLLKARNRLNGEDMPEGLTLPPSGMLDFVLKMITHDATGNSRPKPLSVELLQQILTAFGEIDLANDEELLEEMMEVATVGLTGGEDDDAVHGRRSGRGLIFLDNRVFANALTSDILLYNVCNEIRLTTNYEDVFLKRALEKSLEKGKQGKERRKSDHGNYDSQGKFERSSQLHDRSRPIEEEMSAEADNIESTERSELAYSYDQLNMRQAIARDVNQQYMARSVDMTAGLYRSKALIVWLWATMLITYFAYVFASIDLNGTICTEENANYEFVADRPWQENSKAIRCQVGSSVLTWLGLFLMMSIYGVIFITLGSVGNVNGSPLWKPIFGAVVVILITYIPYFVWSGSDSSDSDDDTTDDDGALENSFLFFASLILGTVTAFYHISHAVYILVGRGHLQRVPWLRNRFITSSTFGEMHAKQACAYKLSRMATNALEVVGISAPEQVALNTRFGQALGEFAISGKKFRKIGGIKWCWEYMRSEEAFKKDGIWISARLIASNIAQYIVTLYVLILGSTWTAWASRNYGDDSSKEFFYSFVNNFMYVAADEALARDVSSNATTLFRDFLAQTVDVSSFGCSNSATNDLFDSFCSSGNGYYDCNASSGKELLCPLLNDPSLEPDKQLALLNASGFDADLFASVTRDAIQQAAEHSVDSLYPSEKYMVVWPLALGTIVAFITSLYIALTYIPSVTRTILRLRSGAIETLRDEDFLRYRIAADQVAILTGSLFWGALVSSILVGGLFGLIVFVLLWQATIFLTQRIVALVIGVIVVTVVRLVIVVTCRFSFYKAFYREKPAAANFSLIALEWANFALSAGFVGMRMIKLLLVAASFIGRIDHAFLAPGVGRIGPLELDNYPVVHTKDLLSHEAHRHPYIELLGVVYMMKLRYGESFGSRAGSTWRLIFVYALFPWLSQYRISARPRIQKSHRKVQEGGGLSSLVLEFKSLHNVNDIVGERRRVESFRESRV